MKLSVIIPARNAEKTLGACLSAIDSSEAAEYDLSVIDDFSEDGTAKIAGRYPCKLYRLERHRGVSYARNFGIRNTDGEILVFIDSDIVIESGVFKLVEETFTEREDVCALIGLFSRKIPSDSLFSNYKNLYMHYVFAKCPEKIDFVNGSFYAIRRKCSEPHNEGLRFGEDDELGLRLVEKGHMIIIEKRISITHLKEYTFLSLMRNDYWMAYSWAKFFLHRKGVKKICDCGRFSHAHAYQIVSIPLGLCALLFLMAPDPWMKIVFLLALFAVNCHFISFMTKERGYLFSTISFFITWVSMIVMAIGIMFGFLHEFSLFILNKVFKKKSC